MTTVTPFGPNGEAVYKRTYSRVKADGSLETWPETVARVVTGNIGLVYGTPDKWTEEVQTEAADLTREMLALRILPAGRHLWASGVKGRTFLMNCWVSDWTDDPAEHFEFTFLRLMEGGGVGTNYTGVQTRYAPPWNVLRLHIVCDPGHEDYEALAAAGALSDAYSSDWSGSFEIEDSREGWAAALVDLIRTSYASGVEHADRVYDVSNVRPAGARLRTFGGTASGPVPLAKMLRRVVEVLNLCAAENAHMSPLDAMEIDHGIAECVVAGGVRRSARMSILHWEDPHIFQFIGLKRDTGSHWTTNISVAVDNEFIDGLRSPSSLASGVHEAVVEGMLQNGEPGYWNEDRSQRGEVGKVVCTNPCGEIVLEPWEPCNLGHVNLEAFAPRNRFDRTDFAGLYEAHRLMARFLVRATFGDVTDPKSRAILDRNRRIGVGHLGVQGFLVRNKTRYSDAPQAKWFVDTLVELGRDVRQHAADYAFDLRIPEPVKVTTVAPTGTVAKLAGVSEGIHPIYARYFVRRIRFSMLRPEEQAMVEEYRAQGFEVEKDLYADNTVVVCFPSVDPLVKVAADLGLDPSVVESADEISLGAMLAMQALYQRCYADNAVSATLNFPMGALGSREVARELQRWLPSLKGTTLMPDGSRPQAPYERITDAEFESMTRLVDARVESSNDEECATGACPIR